LEAFVQHSYLTTEEVARLLRTSPETVRFWRHTGKGPASFKVGRRVLYDRNELDRWVAAAQVEPRAA
jgi:excisionase family DNA binding protein